MGDRHQLCKSITACPKTLQLLAEVLQASWESVSAGSFLPQHWVQARVTFWKMSAELGAAGLPAELLPLVCAHQVVALPARR